MRRSGVPPARTGGRPGDATYGSWQLRRLSPMVTAGHLITAQVVVGAVSLVINAMSARTMGPTGRGDLALLLQITYVANLIAVAGVDRSYAATVPPEHGVRSAIRDTVRLVAPTAAVVIVGAAAVAWWIDGSGRHQRVLAAAGLVLTALSLVAASTLRTAATATGVTRPYVLSALVGQVTLLASAVLLTAAGVGSSDLWLLGYGAALSVGPLAAWLLLRRSGGPPARATRDLSAARRLGLRLLPAALASMVLLRGDRLLLPWLGSYDDLGIYGRDPNALLGQLVGHPGMSPGRLFQGGELEDAPLSSLGHPVLRVRHPARHLDQRRLAALLVQVPEPVEAVAGKSHDPAGVADAAELLRQLQHADLVADDLLVPRHRVVSSLRYSNVYARRRHPRHRNLSDLI